jgi:hypothetical protein
MDNTLPPILSLVLLAIGIIWKFSQGSPVIRKSVGLVAIGTFSIALVYLQVSSETDPSILFLAGAILLSGFCTLLSQDNLQQANDETYSSTMIILALSLGILLSPPIINNIFLVGFLGFIAISINRGQQNTFRTKIIFLHIALAITFSFSSAFTDETLQVLSRLFLAVTFLPLAPFHLPFIRIIKEGKGNLPSLWIVMWLAIGLNELNSIYSSLSKEALFALSLLAFFSAVYASFASLAQRFNSLFVASATVAHVALIWGLIQVFPAFSTWGIPFGITLAFVMSGISLAFSFVRLRYGWKTLGILPGLASPMPRFGVAMVLLVGFALFLPFFPTISGLMVMPTMVSQDIELIMISLLYLVVWLGGGWYFIQMLHQTAYGEARTDVPYSDLQLTEFVAVSTLIIGATYSGMIH